jgi:hypothetical protein
MARLCPQRTWRQQVFEKNDGAKWKRLCLQFTVLFLEVCDLFMTNQYIIERENFWKEILLTREFGYNIV